MEDKTTIKFDLDSVYPIGSIYFQMIDNQTPQELFGGIWEEIGREKRSFNIDVIYWKRIQ